MGFHPFNISKYVLLAPNSSNVFTAEYNGIVYLTILGRGTPATLTLNGIQGYIHEGASLASGDWYGFSFAVMAGQQFSISGANVVAVVELIGGGP